MYLALTGARVKGIDVLFVILFFDIVISWFVSNFNLYMNYYDYFYYYGEYFYYSNFFFDYNIIMYLLLFYLLNRSFYGYFSFAFSKQMIVYHNDFFFIPIVLTFQPISASGIATHFVPAEQWAEFEKNLLYNGNADEIDSLINHYHSEQTLDQSQINWNFIESHFGHSSLMEIIQSLKADPSELAQTTLMTLLGHSPSSLRVFISFNDLIYNEHLKSLLIGIK